MTAKDFKEGLNRLARRYRDATDPGYQAEVVELARATLEDDFTVLQRRMRDN